MKTETEKNLLVGLAGQQNAGKSTSFNMFTGTHQHIANYPGVTVDKKSGFYSHQSRKVELVDLPGTYSLNSFSLEERVARDFLIQERPDVLINVADVTNLKRSLYLTFQLLEMNFPVVLTLNMMDLAKRRGLQVDSEALSQSLRIPVIETVGRKGKGDQAVKSAVNQLATQEVEHDFHLDYQALEPILVQLTEQLASLTALAQQYPLRWLALKLLEQDQYAENVLAVQPEGEALQRWIHEQLAQFERRAGLTAADHMMACRDRLATDIVSTCLTHTQVDKPSLTSRIDKVLLQPVLAPFFLVASIFLIYQLSIVQGYELTKYTWPYLAKFRELVGIALPDAGYLVDPYIRSMGLWMVDSANTLLNYIPIFLILFALIAMLEDSGYMARIAFILDKVFHRFGLHGQSTLPLILGGVFAGGCAVPGIMSTKGIPDNRARMATILTVPFMNCLAKIPFYTLLVNIFFVEHKSWVMLFISTISILMALLIAKLLTTTALRHYETAPFIMELPNYHLPTLTGVLRRAVDRTWVYIKKVGSIVIAVSVFIFSALQFPGLSAERMGHYEQRAAVSIDAFYAKYEGNTHADALSRAELLPLLNFYDDYRRAKLNAQGKAASQAVDARFKAENAKFFSYAKRSRDKAMKKVQRGIKQLSTQRKQLRQQIKEERITTSILGKVGRALEPVTQYAGFDWKINVALLSSFAARESSVATLGVLFQEGADDNQALETRMGNESGERGLTSLHALAIIIFFVLYPPCLASTMMVKVQTNSYKWMSFAIVFPTVIGLVVASLVFTIGSVLQLTGIQMMIGFYLFVVLLLAVVGFTKRPVTNHILITKV